MTEQEVETYALIRMRQEPCSMFDKHLLVRRLAHTQESDAASSRGARCVSTRLATQRELRTENVHITRRVEPDYIAHLGQRP